MFLAKVYVTLKPTVNDPHGQTIMDGLSSMGFRSVRSVRTGKYMEIRIAETDQVRARQQADAMCSKLLANPVIETYRIDIENVAP